MRIRPSLARRSAAFLPSSAVSDLLVLSSSRRWRSSDVGFSSVEAGRLLPLPPGAPGRRSLLWLAGPRPAAGLDLAAGPPRLARRPPKSRCPRFFSSCVTSCLAHTASRCAGSGKLLPLPPEGRLLVVERLDSRPWSCPLFRPPGRSPRPYRAGPRSSRALLPFLLSRGLRSYRRVRLLLRLRLWSMPCVCECLGPRAGLRLLL